jgi:hypothetical protein
MELPKMEAGKTMVEHMHGGGGRSRIEFERWVGEKELSSLAGGVAQAVQCLPSKCQALNSNPSTTN